MQDPNEIDSNLVDQMKEAKPKEENKNKTVIIIMVGLAILFLLGATGIIGYLVGKGEREKNNLNSTNNNTTTTVKNGNTTSSSTVTSTTLTYGESPLLFTHEDYPDLAIPYLSSWDVSVEQIEDNGSPGAKTTVITFEKDGHKVIYNISPTLSFGGEIYCHSETNIVQIKDHWYRVGSNGEYTYNSFISEKGVNYSSGNSFEELFDSTHLGGDYDDYYYCDTNVFIGATASVYIVPSGANYLQEKYGGYIDIKLEIDGDENPEIVDEADEMVLSSVFK